MEAVRSVLVTGGNSGIGFALCSQIAEQGCHVLLASRNAANGEEAVKKIIAATPGAQVQLVQLDVTSDASVQAAAKSLSDDGTRLYGIVNNAGTPHGDCVDTNLIGSMRVCKAFMPMLTQSGRVVNVSSASGPMWLSGADARVRAILTSRDVTLEQISDLARQGPKGSYGFSKALLNAYTQNLANTTTGLRINSCTPGSIATKAFGGSKPASEGTVAIKYLLFGDPDGNGRYYGSDAVRSPLDRYRGPGEPPYVGP